MNYPVENPTALPTHDYANFYDRQELLLSDKQLENSLLGGGRRNNRSRSKSRINRSRSRNNRLRRNITRR
jgi:hypothetical protein